MSQASTCHCIQDAGDHLAHVSQPHGIRFCGCTSHEHARRVWECCFSSSLTVEKDESFQQMQERLAEVMLGINPPCIGGDVRDWEKGDESETMVHNMVSTSVVHGSEMPINLSQVCLFFLL